MKYIRTLCLSLLLTVSLPVVSADMDSVTEYIDQVIYEDLPEGTDIALMVYDLTNDKPLYSYRENVMCRPASVQKVITTVAALSSLPATTAQCPSSVIAIRELLTYSRCQRI